MNTVAPRWICATAIVAGVWSLSALLAVSGENGAGSAIEAGHVWTPVGSNWKLTFDDEFNGATIDRRRWLVPDGIPDASYNVPNLVFRASNIVVSNGIADFRVTKIGSGYATAAVTSRHLQKYGYWEARLKVATQAKGISNSFWTDAKGWTFPEIDIVEWLGASPDVNNMTWHYAVPMDGTNAIGRRKTVSGIDFSRQYHVVGMRWEPHKITWYLDGKQIAQETAHVDEMNDAPQQTLLLATIGGWGGNTVDQTTVLPAHLRADYVHIYSDDADAEAVSPDEGYRGPGDAVGSGNP